MRARPRASCDFRLIVIYRWRAYTRARKHLGADWEVFIEMAYFNAGQLSTPLLALLQMKAIPAVLRLT